jgi:ATP adenylyltransferase
MVCPFRHVARWVELTKDERVELLVEARRAEIALKHAYGPELIHLGLNLGRPGGAGIEEHLHLHLVPWRAADGLGNPVRPDVETLPESLDDTYQKLRTAINATTS